MKLLEAYEKMNERAAFMHPHVLFVQAFKAFEIDTNREEITKLFIKEHKKYDKREGLIPERQRDKMLENIIGEYYTIKTKWQEFHYKQKYEKKK